MPNKTNVILFDDVTRDFIAKQRKLGEIAADQAAQPFRDRIHTAVTLFLSNQGKDPDSMPWKTTEDFSGVIDQSQPEQPTFTRIDGGKKTTRKQSR